MIQLQIATQNDIDLIQHLAYEIWQNHYVPIIGQEQVNYMLQKMYAPQALQEQMEQGHVFYLILVENQKIGFISITQKNIEEIHINKFYIAQTYTSQSIGSKAFALLMDLYKNCKLYSLTVNRQNYKSINFYFKLGFKIATVADFDIGNGFVMNDFIMHKQLSNPH